MIINQSVVSSMLSRYSEVGPATSVDFSRLTPATGYDEHDICLNNGVSIQVHLTLSINIRK